MKSSQDITPSPYIHTICGSTITVIAKHEAHAAVPHGASDLGVPSLQCHAKKPVTQKHAKTIKNTYHSNRNKIKQVAILQQSEQCSAFPGADQIFHSFSESWSELDK